MTITEAQHRAAEWREHWLTQPQNYQPPRNAPPQAVIEWHERWRNSMEYAHVTQILTSATTEP